MLAQLLERIAKLADCVLSKNPRKLLGQRFLDIDKDITYYEVPSSDESGVDDSRARMESTCNTRNSKSQPTGNEGKTGKERGPCDNRIVGCRLERLKAHDYARQNGSYHTDDNSSTNQC